MDPEADDKRHSTVKSSNVFQKIKKDLWGCDAGKGTKTEAAQTTNKQIYESKQNPDSNEKAKIDNCR